ncbi:unnamed protein product [Amoebophrya sp. A25]|nr:unnamed protein product [Amoebophrya sp. A25]|eukprot:GSA25T00016506001.1
MAGSLVRHKNAPKVEEEDDQNYIGTTPPADPGQELVAERDHIDRVHRPHDLLPGEQHCGTKTNNEEGGATSKREVRLSSEGASTLQKQIQSAPMRRSSIRREEASGELWQPSPNDRRESTIVYRNARPRSTPRRSNASTAFGNLRRAETPLLLHEQDSEASTGAGRAEKQLAIISSSGREEKSSFSYRSCSGKTTEKQLRETRYNQTLEEMRIINNIKGGRGRESHDQPNQLLLNAERDHPGHASRPALLSSLSNSPLCAPPQDQRSVSSSSASSTMRVLERLLANTTTSANHESKTRAGKGRTEMEILHDHRYRRKGAGVGGVATSEKKYSPSSRSRSLRRSCAPSSEGENPTPHGDRIKENSDENGILVQYEDPLHSDVASSLGCFSREEVAKNASCKTIKGRRKKSSETGHGSSNDLSVVELGCTLVYTSRRKSIPATPRPRLPRVSPKKSEDGQMSCTHSSGASSDTFNSTWIREILLPRTYGYIVPTRSIPETSDGGTRAVGNVITATGDYVYDMLLTSASEAVVAGSSRSSASASGRMRDKVDSLRSLTRQGPADERDKNGTTSHNIIDKKNINIKDKGKRPSREGEGRSHPSLDHDLKRFLVSQAQLSHGSALKMKTNKEHSAASKNPRTRSDEDEGEEAIHDIEAPDETFAEMRTNRRDDPFLEAAWRNLEEIQRNCGVYGNRSHHVETDAPAQRRC